MGINDCGYEASSSSCPLDLRLSVILSRTDADELEPIVEQIFDTMHELYVKWKARSFLLIDVPPMHNSPGGRVFTFSIRYHRRLSTRKGKAMGVDDERYTTWNAELLQQAESFATAASKASVFVVSSYSIISDILDDPAKYRLSDHVEQEESDDEHEDSDDSDDEADKALWEDDIHLSTAGHRGLADRLWTIFGTS